MGANVPRLVSDRLATRRRQCVAAATFTQRFDHALTGGFGRADSPWLRAAMLTPSVGQR